ncbi:MAG: DUF167 domain-containing protein [Verrucomicrobia bacterium]|nr:DUF167 domain-containing protein [Verrucomicrobiota bacterium]
MLLLPVKVVPKAAKNQIMGWENGELKVRIHAVPEKGMVNAELIAFLAKTLGLPKSSIHLHSGETSRHKKVRIEGMTLEVLNDLILYGKKNLLP